jgi:hypothetical protein
MIAYSKRLPIWGKLMKRMDGQNKITGKLTPVVSIINALMNGRFKPTFLLFLLGGTIFLTFSFYDNNWNVVEPSYYRHWERTYERVVIARIAASEQMGICTGGGLLGLANAQGWDFDADRQYVIYESGEKIENYLAYKSHPGFQGIVFSVLDLVTPFTPSQNIVGIRLISVLFTAFMLALFCAWLAIEFGWLGATFVMLFSAFSEWMILPAANSYWSLWALYLPFITGILALDRFSKSRIYSGRKIYLSIFIAALVKVLFTGFEMITTAWIMATVPFVYYAITGRWTWKVVARRLVLLGIVLLAATLVGLVILSVQIAANDGDIFTAYEHILDRLNRRALGDPDKYSGQHAESLRVSVFTVLKIYLQMNAFNTKSPPHPWQVPYWILIAIFAFFTIVFIMTHKYRHKSAMPVRGLALVIATWFSITAPLSWFIIFKPTSYIHSFLFPMAWQMPFVLMGFALSGYVIQNLFKRKSV